MLYKLVRPFLFMLDPERAHGLALRYLEWRGQHAHPKPIEHNPIELMGLRFPNRVGLAAGFDKNGVAIPGLASLGFGHLEIGTVTPLPQQGNPRPRIFRLSDHQAVINRMGFPNEGVNALVERLKQLPERPILGINLGKNKDTPNEDAVNDYVLGLQKVYPYADYITINISSPNTPQLRELQAAAALQDLLTTLKNMQSLLSHEHQRYVPLVVKVAPDLDPDQIAEMAQILVSTEMDGLIATNTTLSRAGVENSRHGAQTGGLSGAPLAQHATSIIREFRKHLGPAFPIIGVGGILSVKDAQDKLDAGAQLVQLYSGLVYAGPDLVAQVAKALI
jgi:dihydroorotate dehydrogenase